MSEIEFGPPTGPPDPADAAARAQLAADELQETRKAAEGWRNGLASLVALIATVSIVKGPETIEGLPDMAAIGVGVFLFLALLFAVIGARLAIEAAYGDVDLVEIGESVADWKHDRADNARENIKDARGWTYAAMAMIVLAIALLWYVPPEPEAVVTVKAGDTTACGVPRIVGHSLALKDGDESKVVALPDISALTASRDCPD